MDAARAAYKSWKPFQYFYFPLSTQASSQLLTRARRERNLGLLGAYDQADKFLCAAPRFRGILAVLRRMEYRGFVRIATAQSLLSLERLPWDRQVDDAESTIKAALARRDKGALTIFRRALRATGVKRGPKRSEEYNRARIEELRKDMKGVPHKIVASDARQANAVSVRVGRFCRDIRYYYTLIGAPDISRSCDERTATWFKRKLGFHLPDDLPLIRYALRRRTHRR
jgi:hypothetical protein